VPIPATSALGLWLAILTCTLNYVRFVRKRAIAALLSAKSMIMIIASSVLKPVVVVLNLAAKWQPQWLNSPQVLKAYAV